MKGESLVLSVNLTVRNKVIDAVPMILRKILITAGFDNGHSLLECIDEVLEVVNNRVGRQTPEKPVGNLGVMLSVLLNLLIVDFVPEHLLVAFLEIFPLGERLPERMTGLKLTSQLINLTKDGGLSAELLLPLVVLDGGFRKLIKRCHLLIELNNHLTHIRVLVQVLGELALLFELLDLNVKLWDEGFELFLEARILSLLLGLYVGKELL